MFEYKLHRSLPCRSKSRLGPFVHSSFKLSSHTAFPNHAHYFLLNCELLLNLPFVYCISSLGMVLYNLQFFYHFVLLLSQLQLPNILGFKLPLFLLKHLLVLRFLLECFNRLFRTLQLPHNFLVTLIQRVFLLLMPHFYVLLVNHFILLVFVIQFRYFAELSFQRKVVLLFLLKKIFVLLIVLFLLSLKETFAHLRH